MPGAVSLRGIQVDDPVFFRRVSPRGYDFRRMAFQDSVHMVTTGVTVGVVVLLAEVAAFGNASGGLRLGPLEWLAWVRYISPDTY